VLIVDAHGLKDFSINYFIINVEFVHMFTDTLHSSFLAERSQISSDTAVGVLGTIQLVDIRAKLHLLSVDVNNFETAILVRNSNVDFLIESSSSSESRV